MSITADGWFTWMERDPGPRWKTNGGRNGGRGIVPHSAEGYRTELRNILHGPRRASWHASFLTDRTIQHYSIWDQTWTSGSWYPNNNMFAGETEGCGNVEGIDFEPWVPFQTASWARAGRELSQLQGWKARRPTGPQDMTATCLEHTECIRYGSAFTQCPAGRNPWNILVPAINGIEEEEDMKSFLCWDTTNRRVMFVGPAGPKWITQPSVVSELERAFGKMEVALSAPALQALGG